MWNLIINGEEYFTVLLDLLDLEIWYAVQAAQHEKRPLADTLNQYTEIYFYSTQFNPDIPAGQNPAWQNVVAQIAENPTAARKILIPYIEPRIKTDLQKGRKEIKESYNGFMYEFCPEYNSDSKEDFLTLHFRNYFAPESPFEHKRELELGLLKLVERAVKERPDVKQVQCASWLNNVPQFISLFPEQWTERANFCYPIAASSGWWGRFIDRRGYLNQRAVAELRKTKTFSAPNRHCRCMISKLYDYVSGTASENQLCCNCLN